MISDEEAALWRRAVAKPTIPGALEAYAEWLMTNAPERGKFVMKRLRSSEPFPIHLDEIFQEIGAWGSALGLRHGAYDSITLNPIPSILTIWAERLGAVSDLLDRLPFLHIHVRLHRGSIDRVFADPTMAKIRALSFSAVSEYVDDTENYQSMNRSYFGADVIRALCASPNVTQFEVLWVSDESGSECATQLARVPFFQLRELSLSGEPIGDAGAIALASSSHMATLRDLRIAHCDIGDAGILAIAASPHLAGLETLDVMANRFGPEALARLRAMRLRQLIHSDR